MDGRAHDRRLHDPAALEGSSEIVAFEAVHPRPQADVHRRRVLRLEPAHALEDPGDRRAGPLEQELAREQSAVELAPGQDSFPGGGHRTELPRRGSGRRLSRARGAHPLEQLMRPVLCQRLVEVPALRRLHA